MKLWDWIQRCRQTQARCRELEAENRRLKERNAWLEQFNQFTVRPPERLAGFAEEFGHVAPGNFDSQHVAEQIANPAVGSVQPGFAVGGQGRQARAKQSRTSHLQRKGSVMVTVTVLTPNPLGDVLGDHDRLIRQIDLLQDCLLYTSDAADDLTRVDLGGRRIIKK